MKNLLYLSDCSLPNKSAYAVHIMKMCDAFAKKFKVDLIVNSSSTNQKKIFTDYNMKNKVNIIPLNNLKKKDFLSKLINAYKTYKIIKKNNYNFIISRNVFLSFFLANLNVRNTIEIHTELSGFTKQLFNYSSKKKLKKNLKFIFIHKSLNNYFNFKKSYIVLDDAIDLSDFEKIKTRQVSNKFVYTGSYLKGKGIELILDIAEYFKKYKFCLYGNIDTFPKDLIERQKGIKNLELNDHIPYKKIPKILKSAEFLLMPYPKRIEVLIKNINVKNYISPLKMFEYLASKKIIFASKNESYKHILKNNYNSIMIETENTKQWIQKISFVIRNKKKFLVLKKNSFTTAQKFTWDRRSKKIIEFSYEK